MQSEFSIEKLIDGLKSNFPNLSVAKVHELIVHAVVHRIAKKELLIKRGLFNGEIYFVAQGLFRAYYEKDGNQDTFWFREEHTVFASHLSILTNRPSNIYYQAVEDSVVMTIPYSLLKDLGEEDIEVTKSINTVLEGLILELIQRIEEFTTLNSEERYFNFLSRYEKIIHRIPQQYIASYIGLTPASFSRLKAKLAKG